MHQNVTDLTPQQNQALELFVEGKTPCNIADTLGIHRQTIWRWRKLPAFQQMQRELLERRREDMRDKLAEVMRLSLASVARELEKVDDPYRSNPIDTAMRVLNLYQRSTLFATLETERTEEGIKASE